MCFKKRPIANMTVQDAVWWLEYDIDLHEQWLNKPENTSTGTYLQHRDWIARFKEVVRWLNGQSPTMSFQYAMDTLREAQATHVEDARRYPVNTHEYRWNYDWFYVYDNIIDLLEDEYGKVS